ncbi:MAG: HAMP domain-containing histidine kinase [Planctomyces sp.]|nr:HAMP domain-containing histidine kinase [Planctomyces sp.]
MSENEFRPGGNDFEDRLRAAKLEALAEFAAGAGHEINNPLATILGRVERALRRLDGAPSAGALNETRRDLRIIAGQAQRIRDMIGDLMLFARPPAPHRERLDLGEAVRSACGSLATFAAERAIVLDVDLAPGVIVDADPVQTRVLASELIRNAIEASPAGGAVSVSLRAADPSLAAQLLVVDAGPGLGPEDVEHLFDPFYSGRPAGRGLGFGLCKAWRIAELHDARLTVANRPAGGMEASVDWPAAGRSA